MWWTGDFGRIGIFSFTSANDLLAYPFVKLYLIIKHVYIKRKQRKLEHKLFH